MRGPELWGLVIFALDRIKIKEQTTEQEWQARPDQRHIIMITGELKLGMMEPPDRLPKNIWDRQRYGGYLSDGETQFWWIIHDSDIPGRHRVRWFDVVFAKEIHADTTAERMRSHGKWREFVRREWLKYVISGFHEFVQLVGPKFPPSVIKWLSRPRGASRWVRHNNFWVEHEADMLNRSITIPQFNSMNHVPSSSSQASRPAISVQTNTRQQRVHFQETFYGSE